MALFKAWIAEISANPSLVTSAVEEGLHQLGYESIKPEQLAAVESLLKGEDVFMSVPTGFGKSLVYQVLPFCSESLLRSCKNSRTFESPVVIVVSPLISLMHDQVSKLVAKGVKAMCISGEKSDDAFTDVVESRVTHVFGSPEAFVGNKTWRSLFSDDRISGRVVALAIDEAHCIVKWGMGDDFRAWYGKISQLRSLLPSNTPVVALTATATHSVKDRIVHALQMAPVQLITKPANRPNLRFSVERVNRDVHKTFKWLISDLKRKRTTLPRVIVFCRSIHTCAALYKTFLTEMKEDSYEPRASPPSISTRLFAMYHSRVGEDEKQQIMQSILNPHGNCRVLFSTTAFGMGVDVPNIRTVIHFGPPADMDDYFQECGRAGRDGLESNAILYLYAGCLMGHVSNHMKEYCKLEKRCRRRALLQNFIGGVDTTTIGYLKHNCCDICTQECTCSVECPFQACVRQTEPNSSSDDDDDDENEEFVRIVTQGDRERLRTRLLELRDTVLQSTHQQCEGMSSYVGFDIVCGLPSEMVESVVNHCEFIADSFDVEEKCLVWNWAGEIYRIIDDIFD